jgi:hypothetical protein
VILQRFRSDFGVIAQRLKAISRRSHGAFATISK